MSAWASNYMSVLASKYLDISTFKCVHMWSKNKSNEGVTFNLNVNI